MIDEKASWAAVRLDAPIELADVERLLEPWRAGRVVTAATFLPGGLMNRNYRVRVGSDDVVLRFYDRDARACTKETAIYNELLGRVAVPRVLYVAPLAETVRFAVLELIDGISLRDLKRSGNTPAVSEASYDAGVQLAQLAAFRMSDPALLAVDLPMENASLDGSNINARLIDHFLASPLVRARLGDEHLVRVHDFAWLPDDQLSNTDSSSMIAHGDFNSANILVKEEAGQWKVAAILDWEFAFSGSTFYVFGNFLRYERASQPRFEPSFSRGLADGGFALDDEWRTTARRADLVALCELLTRIDVPEPVAAEVRELVLATVDGRDPLLP